MTQSAFDHTIIADFRARMSDGDTIAFVSGNFNVVHPGHVRLLSFAKETGTYLVVGVAPDTSPGVSVPADLRLEAVRSIKNIDYAFILSEELESVILALKPEIVVKGKEHETSENRESELVQSYGGRLLFSSGDMRFSSLNLLERDYQSSAVSAIHLPDDYPKRHNFTLPGLIDLAAGFSERRVIVVGDLIVDDYVE